MSTFNAGDDAQFWDQLDWTKSDRELAAITGVSKAQINAKRKQLGKPTVTRKRDKERTRFKTWLTSFKSQQEQIHGDGCRLPTMKELIKMSNCKLFYSAAYRIACEVTGKGQRQNHSAYDGFWSQLNWALPTRVLAEIWQIDPGNLATRRKRSGAPKARWKRVNAGDPPHHWHASYFRAVCLEREKAKKYTGPKPGGRK